MVVSGASLIWTPVKGTDTSVWSGVLPTLAVWIFGLAVPVTASQPHRNLETGRGHLRLPQRTGDQRDGYTRQATGVKWERRRGRY